MPSRLPPDDLPRKQRQPDNRPADEDVQNCLKGPDHVGGYVPPIDQPGKRSYCLACDLEIKSRSDGSNLADPENVQVFHLHHRCLDKLSTEEKIRIRLLFRQQEVGADLTRVVAEVRQAIIAFHSLINTAMNEYTHRNPEEYGEGQN